MPKDPIAVFYEHPKWFKPMFTEFERRGVPFKKLRADQHWYDPHQRNIPYSLIVNRMSPSAGTRGRADTIPYTMNYLAYLKDIGANVLNGYDAYLNEFSKAGQIALLSRLGIRHPSSRVINHIAQAFEASKGLDFPVVVKPNVGGSGAGIQKFDTPDALLNAVDLGTIDLGLDGTALVQSFLPARGNNIVRVEVLNGQFLYAIRLYLQSNDTFNLCPADYCEIPAEEASHSDSDYADDGVTGRNLLVEGYIPPQEIIDTVLRITKISQIEVGGVEYLINDRDGKVYFYDINALSNFVADAPNVIGFDPFPKLVDFILERAEYNQPIIEGETIPHPY